MTARERMKELYDRRRAAGQCVNCEAPSVRFARCKSCRAVAAEKVAKCVAAKKEAARVIQTPPARGQTLRCSVCGDQHREFACPVAARRGFAWASPRHACKSCGRPGHAAATCENLSHDALEAA